MTTFALIFLPALVAIATTSRAKPEQATLPIRFMLFVSNHYRPLSRSWYASSRESFSYREKLLSAWFMWFLVILLSFSVLSGHSTVHVNSS